MNERSKTIDVVYNAWKEGTMVPSFNVACLPMVEPIVQAVVDQDSFALIASAQIEWQLGSKGPREVMEEFRKWENPRHVRLHLDHIASIDELTSKPNDYCNIIKNAISMGFYSVMIDGSHEKDIESNINATRKIVDMASEKGVLVEAETGYMFGYDSDNAPSHEKIMKERLGFTKEEEVSRMAAESGCDWLSVAVGNMHGAMMGKAQSEQKQHTSLDLDLIRKLSMAANIPLVIHGGSGIQLEYLLSAFKLGVAKINVAKDLRLCYRQALEKTETVAAAQEALYERVCVLIKDYKIAGTAKIIAPG